MALSDPGEYIRLLGRNGMGKTTTIRGIVGMTGPHRGAITSAARPAGWPSIASPKLASVWCPKGAANLPQLTAWREPHARPTRRAATAHLDHGAPSSSSPGLRAPPSSGAQLSGGEQQMLAIGRALMTNPGLLILDEATEGLAPMAIRQEIWKVLRQAKTSGQSILIVDKKFLSLLAPALDRHYVLERGRVRWSGDFGGARADLDVIRRFVGV